MVLDIRESQIKIKSNLNFPVRSSILFEIYSFFLLYYQCLFEVKSADIIRICNFTRKLLITLLSKFSRYTTTGNV